MRVLIVDDEPVILEILDDDIRSEFPQALIDLASDGESALQFCHKNKYDFIITDEHMPGLKGHEFLKEITDCARNKGAIKLVISAHLSRETRSELGHFGAVIFQKPYYYNELIDLIKGYLSVDKAEKDVEEEAA